MNFVGVLRVMGPSMVGVGDLQSIQSFHQVMFIQATYLNCFLFVIAKLLWVYVGAAASSEVQSERLLLARPSVSVVACLLDPLIKYLCCQSQPRKGLVATRLAMALAGCAQRSGSLSTIL